MRFRKRPSVTETARIEALDALTVAVAAGEQAQAALADGAPSDCPEMLAFLEWVAEFQVAARRWAGQAL